MLRRMPMVPKVVTLFARTALGVALLVPSVALAADSGEDHAAPRSRHAGGHHAAKRGGKKGASKRVEVASAKGATTKDASSKEASSKEASAKDAAREAPAVQNVKDES